MNININGKSFEFHVGETVLDVAKRNNIDIPTLCFDERFKPYGSCFVCIVKDNKNSKIIPSCSASAADGMDIVTEDEEILKYRRMALELLLSAHDADCFSPCKTSCPAGIDARDYILYSKLGMEFEGFLTVRKKNPLVASIGRVCPAFCEEDCSRNHIDETISIRLIKRYLADTVYENYYDRLLEEEKKLIQRPKSPKKIAIIGGGPASLSASYYLALAGHKVTIYESNEKLGGMLRYAIPSFRLPVNVLDREIESIVRLGVDVKCGERVSKERLEKLSKENDTVLVATGTWKESGLWLDEDNYSNIIPAIAFLRSVVLGEICDVGKSVIVVGGGNSAIDAARVSLRLGAKKVNLLYRRTREQMPALDIEIEDALREGIELFELMSPTQIIPGDEKGRAKAVVFERMKLLDEIDSSGRKKVKGTGEHITFDCDTLIYAIGQKPETELIDHIKGSNLSNVYLCGDANKGASTVIEAVADARKAAYKIMDNVENEMDFYSIREKGVLVSRDYEELKKQKVSHLNPKKRITSFDEVESGYSTKVAGSEGDRCINCGCAAIEDCDLRKYAIEYGADPLRFKEDLTTGVEHTFLDDTTQYLLHDPGKCIKCAKCINVCSEVAGASALSFIDRGLDAVISSNPENDISKSSCMLCGMCIDLCPTGAMSEAADDVVWTGIEEEMKECEGCVLKCNLNYGKSDGKVFRARSYDTPICSIGRWGWADDYKEISKYYKGTISKKKVKLENTKIADPDVFNKCDYVLSLAYNPSGDNPRVFDEFKKLEARGVRIDTIHKGDRVPDLSSYKKPLIIFNYLDHPMELVEGVLKKYSGVDILPVYYRLS